MIDALAYFSSMSMENIMNVTTSFYDHHTYFPLFISQFYFFLTLPNVPLSNSWSLKGVMAGYFGADDAVILGRFSHAAPFNRCAMLVSPQKFNHVAKHSPHTDLKLSRQETD